MDAVVNEARRIFAPTADRLLVGAIVTVTGIVAGRTRMPDGRTSYLVQYEQKGKMAQDWFLAEDVDDLGFDG